ncbi:MAG TPA: YceD family protein [Arenimonas sp.]|uniref:YceD family protein n=1 Tax=Arenimonas sp. TaxID=1872635 RepID=UPI002BE29702|nr:YceD family protein [Arenimonas sp.]HMB56024.1 YceD family protein [Arenimonas sp.]
MSAPMPPVLDAWRMVTAQRSFEGVVALTDLPRLKVSLTDPEGECRFTLEFGRDDLGLAFVEVRADANLPLLCQRTLERYLHPVSVVQRLGLITDEAQESALPEGMEPLLLDEHGQLRGIDLVEDELILALPVVPINPDSTELQAEWPEEFVKEDKPNPFAALAALKDRKK